MNGPNTNPEESIAAIRKARALAALKAIQAESVRKGLDKMTMGEIDAVIQEVRRSSKQIECKVTPKLGRRKRR